MPLPVLHKRFAQAAVKMVTAPTGPVAALSERPVGSNSTAGGHWCTSRSPDVSLRGAKRRGNLAVPSRITGHSRRNRDCLPEIAPQGHFLALRAQGATSACGLLAMTSRGLLPFYRQPVRIGSIAPGGACPSPTMKCPSAAWPRTGFPYYFKGSKSSAPCLHSGQI